VQSVPTDRVIPVGSLTSKSSPAAVPRPPGVWHRWSSPSDHPSHNASQALRSAPRGGLRDDLRDGPQDPADCVQDARPGQRLGAERTGDGGTATRLGGKQELPHSGVPGCLHPRGHRAAKGSNRFAGRNARHPLIAASATMSRASSPASAGAAGNGARPPSRGEGAAGAWTGLDTARVRTVFGLEPGTWMGHGHGLLVEHQAQGSIEQGHRSRGGCATDSFMEQGLEDAGRRTGDPSAGNSGEGGRDAVRNVERATAAVTRYGCGRGKGSEG
jgi:hypothetical protein